MSSGPDDRPPPVPWSWGYGPRVRETPLPIVLHAVRTGDVSVLREVPDDRPRTARGGRATRGAAGAVTGTVARGAARGVASVVARVVAVAAALAAMCGAVVGVVLLGGP